MKAPGPLIAVVGPTASGKTDWAERLAREFDGELISADSRQFYRGFSIATAKPIGKSSPHGRYQTDEGMIYHLIDIREPDETMNLAEFQRLARDAWADISKRGKLPIVVGGTGLYIEAVITDLKLPGVKSDRGLREELNDLSTVELAKKFRDLDLESEMDLSNRHRLVRSIELLVGGAKLKDFEKAKIMDGVVVVAPERDPEELRQIITARVGTMVTDGLVEEVKRAYEQYSPELPSMSCIAFPIFKLYLDGEITLEEAKKRFASGDAQYAKRQRTWWRRRSEVNWLESYDEARELVHEHVCA